MEFYTAEDMRAARLTLRRCGWIAGGGLALLLALYVWAALRGAREAMLALMLLALAGSIFAGDLWILPARRYVRFLHTLESGLRRRTRCRVEAVGDAVELQDGVRVRTLEVRLCPDGDTRIFYLNASKAAQYPAIGAQIELTSCGRHAVGWKTATETKDDEV